MGRDGENLNTSGSPLVLELSPRHPHTRHLSPVQSRITVFFSQIISSYPGKPATSVNLLVLKEHALAFFLKYYHFN